MWHVMRKFWTNHCSNSEVCETISRWSGQMLMKKVAFKPGCERQVDFDKHRCGEYIFLSYGPKVVRKRQKRPKEWLKGCNFWWGCVLIWAFLCAVDVSVNWYSLLERNWVDKC